MIGNGEVLDQEGGVVVASVGSTEGSRGMLRYFSVGLLALRYRGICGVPAPGTRYGKCLVSLSGWQSLVSKCCSPGCTTRRRPPGTRPSRVGLVRENVGMSGKA